MAKKKTVAERPAFVFGGMEAPDPEQEVFYARVSTEDQTLENQFELARRRGIPEDNWFSDVASAAAKRRHGFEVMLKFIGQRPGWKIVTQRLDRLGRDTKKLLDLVEYLDKENVGLVSLTEQLDTKTPMGRMIFTLKAAFAQMERELIRERTQAGMDRLKAQGVHLGRKTKIKPAQFKDIERRLIGTKEGIAEIAARHKISPSSVNYWFPGWRQKTKAARAAYRKANPLPIT